ncbi:MAG: hypothetical protein IM473_03010 [Microcystis sp. M015S2]|uniref:hypothetical protein n=1 Tax=Microcystis TaxID=1125 RepID=UPI001314AC54|nr:MULTISPECIES: hypothetical protein [Microcystis]MCA2627179.1 hypothetical protein [Microcystis sp. M091S2]MCA2741405.1 hypothetical protein [Microcystis sp. M015S2]MCA2817222.1 hypothetical protein [Microcystis sp. M085S1]MCA2855307.1 hypothetical protein [Microcystis sp. M065S1]MCZ8162510.1 hypothetical protein [Microcystis sp. LE19-196.1B]MCZ8272304.1 hypothetical protein [Microcystis sp. LE19-4.1E]
MTKVLTNSNSWRGTWSLSLAVERVLLFLLGLISVRQPVRFSENCSSFTTNI